MDMQIFYIINFFLFNLLNLLLHAIHRINHWTDTFLNENGCSAITKINIVLFFFLFIDIIMWWTC